MFGPSGASAWGARSEPLLDAAVASDDDAERGAAGASGGASSGPVQPPPAVPAPAEQQQPDLRAQGACCAASPPAGPASQSASFDPNQTPRGWAPPRADAAALQAALSSAAAGLVKAALSAAGSAASAAAAAAAPKATPAATHTPASPWRFPAFMQPRGRAAAADAPLAAPLLGGGAQGGAMPHPGGTRLARARAAVVRWLPASVERSIPAYATVVGVCGATGLACVPSFPLLWRCAGVLPVFSLFLIAAFYGAAFAVALLPEATNLLPAAALTGAMTTYYAARLGVADRGKVRGPRSAADVALLCLSVAELAVLAAGARARRRAHLRRALGLV